MSEEISDYSKNSLEQLYDLANHIDRERFPDRYRIVLQEISRRREGPLRFPVVFRSQLPVLQEILNPDQAMRNYATIAVWWERRRGVYNKFFRYAYSSSAATTMFFGLFARPFDISGTILTLLISILLCLIIFLPVWFIVHVAYTAAYIIDAMLLQLLKPLGWRVTLFLFATVFALTLVVVSLPAVEAFLTLFA